MLRHLVLGILQVVLVLVTNQVVNLKMIAGVVLVHGLLVLVMVILVLVLVQAVLGIIQIVMMMIILTKVLVRQEVAVLGPLAY